MFSVIINSLIFTSIVFSTLLLWSTYDLESDSAQLLSPLIATDDGYYTNFAESPRYHHEGHEDNDLRYNNTEGHLSGNAPFTRIQNINSNNIDNQYEGHGRHEVPLRTIFPEPTCTVYDFVTDVCGDYFRRRKLLGFIPAQVIELLVLSYAFAGLAMSADHMCNSMETLCDHWKVLYCLNFDFCTLIPFVNDFYLPYKY